MKDTQRASLGKLCHIPYRERRVSVNEPAAAERLTTYFYEYLHGYGSLAQRGLLFLCVGTDRSTGDSLGPLVGTFLEWVSGERVKVLGTLDSPVHASNLEDIVGEIGRSKTAQLVVAVDACLGRLENVGTITIGRGALKPGVGVNKTLPPVGQIYVTGTVNVGGFMEYFVLQNTRLSLVMNLANTIAAGLSGGYFRYLRSLGYKGRHHEG